MATEQNPAQSKRHTPRRDDDVAEWLKRKRDDLSPVQMMTGGGEITSPVWRAVDDLLNRYRECADYGLSLRPEDDEHGD